MNVLGIHIGHDSAVALVQDGKLVARLFEAAQGRASTRCFIDIGMDCLVLGNYAVEKSQ